MRAKASSGIFLSLLILLFSSSSSSSEKSIFGHRWKRSEEVPVWNEETSLAPLPPPNPEDLTMCSAVETSRKCFHKSPNAMGWEDAHSYCRNLDGFLPSHQEYKYLEYRWPQEWWAASDNVTWTALTSYQGHYQWISRTPSISVFEKWRETPKNWSRDCATFNLSTSEFQLNDCKRKLFFFCALDVSQSTSDASLNFSDMELRVTGNFQELHGMIKLPTVEFKDLALTCQAFKRSTGEQLAWQPHYFWRKDSVYFNHSDGGLDPSSIFDSSKSEFVAPGISSNASQHQFAQGTYWCESWLPHSTDKLSSNKVLVTLDEWVTLIFNAHLQENAEINHEKVIQDLFSIFHDQFKKIFTYTWDLVSSEREPIPESNAHIAKYTFHVHMPRTDLNLQALRKVNLSAQYNKLFKDGDFLSTSTLSYATFCYREKMLINNKNSLLWPFTEVGYVYPRNHICKVDFGKLSPGVCKGNYTSGASLSFDISQCKWQDRCPKGYRILKKNVCVAVSHPADWETGFVKVYKTGQESSVLANDSLILASRRNYNMIRKLTLEVSNQTKLWLPLKRELHLGPLIFQGPGKPSHNYHNYDEFANHRISWVDQHPRSDQDCLAFDLETRQLQTYSCLDKLPFLAVINIQKSQSKTNLHEKDNLECIGKNNGACLCDDGWNNSIFKGENEICFKLFKNTGNVSWTEAKNFCENKGAQLPSPNAGFLDWVYRQHLVAENVFSVWMGIEWIPDRILYSGPVDTINWLSNTNYSFQYGTLRQDGWLLESNETTKENILCQMIIEPEVSMQLQVNEPRSEGSQTMCIDVTPIQLLMNEVEENMKCFVNGRELAYERTEDSGCQYELKISGQGYYQCKAWTRPPFGLTKSNTILLRDDKKYTFVITLSENRSYIPQEHDITFTKQKSFDSCRKVLRSYLGSSYLSPSFKFRDTYSFYTPEVNSSRLLHNFHLESKIEMDTNKSEIYLLESLKKMLIIDGELNLGDCKYSRIRSTKGCPSDITIDNSSEVPRNLTWPQTEGNEIVISEELCITPNGEPVTRECLGDFLEGYYWDKPSDTCSGVPTNVTRSLWKLNKSILDQTIGTYLVNLTSDQASLLPADIHFVSKAFQKLSKENSTLGGFDELVSVVNNVMGANATVFDMIQKKLNSSSALLGALEDLTFKYKLPNVAGDQVKKTSNNMLSVERLDLEANSTIIGYKSHGVYEETLLMGYQKEDLLDAEAAIILPRNLTYTVASKSVRKPRNRILEEKDNKVPVLFAVFQNEKLFQDNASYTNYTVNSRIIMASYKGEVIKDLDEPVKIFFKPLKRGNNTKCVYWDFALNNDRGGWSEKGCVAGKPHGEHDVCLCSHLTNFAQLINYDEDSGFEGTHKVILDIITIIGCCTSIIGLLLVFTTFLVFKKWRRSLSNKILVNLSFSIFCSNVIFLAGVDQTWNEQLCRSVAVGLHYFILASFGWMLVEAVHQYLKFVKVVGTYIPRFLWKASICAWGIPVLPILVVLIYDHSLYDSKNDYNSDFQICWMSVKGFKYAFLPPLTLTMSVNIIMYSLIIYGAICGRARVNSTMSERTQFMNQLRMAVCVFFLLGFTWIFGLLAVVQIRLVFSYLFCIFNTLQGFFLFVLHVCREQGARKYWKDFLSVLTKDSVSSSPGNSFHQVNSHLFRGHPDSVSFDRCGGILVLPQGPAHRSHLRRNTRTSLLSSRTDSTLIQSRASFNP